MIRRKIIEIKQQIISEYLSGDDTFAALGVKYGVNLRTIQSWVREFRKQHPSITVPSDVSDDAQVKALKKQLAHAQLKNELLEEMLRLTEEQTGVDWRKKYGARQS